MATDPFDLQDFLPYLLNRAGEASSQRFQAIYRSRYGMVRTEWRVLFHLGRYGDLTARAICDRADLHKTKVSRAVAALGAKRLLTRETVAADRRQEVLRLTRQGHAVFADLVAAARDFDAQMTAAFTDDESAVLRRCLTRIAAK